MCVDDINLPESQIWLFLFSAQSPSVILIASQREFLLFSWHSKVSNVITKYLSVHSPYINHSMSLLYTLYAPDCPPHPLFLLKHTSCFYSRYFFQTWWASLLHLSLNTQYLFGVVVNYLKILFPNCLLLVHRITI